MMDRVCYTASRVPAIRSRYRSGIRRTITNLTCHNTPIASNAESEGEGDFGWSEWLALVRRRPTIRRSPTSLLRDSSLLLPASLTVNTLPPVLLNHSTPLRASIKPFNHLTRPAIRCRSYGYLRDIKGSSPPFNHLPLRSHRP